MCAKILASLDKFPKPYKVEVGSGGYGREKWAEWIHCDPHVPAEHHIEIECYAWELPFEDASVGHIYGRGMWEHLNYHKCEMALTEWLRALIPGGLIEFNFPPIDRAIDQFVRGIVDYVFLRGLLYGWQKFDLDTHKSGWTELSIKEFLSFFENQLSTLDIFSGVHETNGDIIRYDTPDRDDPGVHIWVRAQKKLML